MSGTHINRARLNKCIDTVLDKDYNKIMLKPVNNHFRFDIHYLRAYIINYNSYYANQFEKKLIKITDVEPEKTYFSRWRKYRYQLKPEDLKHHWNHSCFKDKTEDKSCLLITHHYEKLLENVFSGITNLQLSI
ncbi:hypothetical protein RhiirA1_471161 [Rhizophagus irregularis]|uniref:Uncharacterized protein n=1 Tax=Rhizophagus irregularis TaxID=588596 RepID=A0A2I1FE63_9GLOM|nr:hypothetical protein RhiirA1_471161 [Rhizophagus irregularis]PKY32685.1 hypothetical protein RhiirB3_451052 [Rhizophagus irregularis]